MGDWSDDPFMRRFCREIEMFWEQIPQEGKDYTERLDRFIEEIGVIDRPLERPVPMPQLSAMGHYLGFEVETIRGFCRNSPEYHVASCFQTSDGRFVIRNMFLPNADYYYLADGNSDPRLTFDETIPSCFRLASPNVLPCIAEKVVGHKRSTH